MRVNFSAPPHDTSRLAATEKAPTNDEMRLARWFPVAELRYAVNPLGRSEEPSKIDRRERVGDEAATDSWPVAVQTLTHVVSLRPLTTR